ncbi:uncharacterized protein [Apostichopus japonicus]|uniref:uncharacterized protein isoform X2 n=1 Tax=Stichopus japonicus TaxID=307972 RepID=UPI003AB1FEF9
MAGKIVLEQLMRGVFLFFAIEVFGHQDFQQISSGPLTLQVNQDGSYHIDVDGVTWLESQNTFITDHHIIYSKYHDTFRVISGPVLKLGHNPRLGKYQQIDLIWEARNEAITAVTTTFQVFLETSTIVFSMNFSDSGLKGTSQGSEGVVCTTFPSFKVSDHMKNELGFMSFGFFLAVQNVGRWNSPVKLIGSGMDSAPLTLFNKTKHSIIMSAFNEFMVNSMVHDPFNDGLMFGVQGKIKEIQKGFVHQTILHFGTGIKQTAMNWGSFLKRHYELKRYSKNDVTLNYIGYWTDGGAYYYYNTEPNKTYEETMLDIKIYADALNIPYKYYQIDSWWYYRGIGGNTKNWTAMPSIFPHGAGYVYNRVGHRLAAHNRCWAADTDYAKQNGGKWNFIVEKEKSIPQDKEFWNYLMGSSKKEWGLTMYEQDWLADEVNDLKACLENITVARDWLLGMGYGAMMNNITIQYCEPMPRHLLQSLEIPHLTQARASVDYHPGEIPQWDIGLISIILHALDIRPFKDNFRTVTADEHHPKYKSEPDPFLQCVISLFSMGPVAPSDKIGFTNVTLLKRTMNTDGLLLQPSHPMMTVDNYVIKMAFEEADLGLNGKVWTTFSNVSNFIFGSILSLQMVEDDVLTPDGLDLGMIGPSVAHLDEQLDKTITLFDDKNPLLLQRNNPGSLQLWQTAPTFNFNNARWAILGETAKLVPFSPKRFEVMAVDEDVIRLQVIFGPQETVKLDIYTGTTLWSLTCQRDTAGPLLIEITDINSFNCLIPPAIHWQFKSIIWPN